MNKKVVVIGAGLSGLSSAALLAKNGFDVTIAERNSHPGGVAGQIREKGFVFDTGPTWFLMPEVFSGFFRLFGREITEYVNIVPLDPSYRIIFRPGDLIDITRDLNHNCSVFENREPGSGTRLKDYLSEAEYKYNTAMKDFIYRAYQTIFDFINRKLIFEGMQLHLLKSLDKYVRKFFKTSDLRKIVEFNTVFLGCSPAKTPALYSLMTHADMTIGVGYPMGGIYSLIGAFYRLCGELGVNFKFNSEIKSIEIHKGKAIGVVSEKEDISADIVLSAADYHHTETKLLSPEYQTYPDRYWRKKVIAPTAFLILLGINKKLGKLAHHTLHLSDGWDEHFIDIFNKPAWPHNPSFYIGCPSKTDPSAAPPGSENIFILVPTAPGMDDSKRESYADTIIKKLEEIIGESITENIMFKKIISHRDFSSKFNMYRGTSMGLAHTLFQTAVFRPSHKSGKVANLYYTGCYTHPGIGMPMVVIASQITTDHINEDIK
ncbi:MAG: phytoene desaturase family protein [Pseudomonadota bacterium]